MNKGSSVAGGDGRFFGEVGHSSSALEWKRARGERGSCMRGRIQKQDAMSPLTKLNVIDTSSVNQIGGAGFDYSFVPVAGTRRYSCSILQCRLVRVAGAAFTTCFNSPSQPSCFGTYLVVNHGLWAAS
jgi:hypothetical protein